MKDDKLFLIFILERIERIERYVGGGKAEFLENTLVQDGVLRNLQVLSEATQRVSQSAKATRPDVDWPRIAGFRNILVHDYLGIKLERVWGVVEHSLPGLKSAARAMLDAPGG